MKGKALELDHLGGQEYPMKVYRDFDSGDWVAEVSDLPGCIGVGDTRTEAVAVAERFIRDWIQEALAQGWEVPPPSTHVEASGKFVVRLPRSLHARLQDLAGDEGTSLNQLVVALLSEQFGRKETLRTVQQALAECQQPPTCRFATVWGHIPENPMQAASGTYTTELGFPSRFVVHEGSLDSYGASRMPRAGFTTRALRSDA